MWLVFLYLTHIDDTTVKHLTVSSTTCIEPSTRDKYFLSYILPTPDSSLSNSVRNKISTNSKHVSEGEITG